MCLCVELTEIRNAQYRMHNTVEARFLFVLGVHKKLRKSHSPSQRVCHSHDTYGRQLSKERQKYRTIFMCDVSTNILYIYESENITYMKDTPILMCIHFFLTFSGTLHRNIP